MSDTTDNNIPQKEIKEKTLKEKFNEYCELNPEADECREYDV